MDKLYKSYLLERENAHVVEAPHGFAIYKLAPDHVYLQDIYVAPDYRKLGIGVQLMDKVADIARENNINTMYGSVAPGTPFSTNMMKIMFNLGFTLAQSSNDMIYLKKEL